MKTAAERLRVVDKLRHQHPEKSPEEITDMADLVARTHPQFRAGRRRSILIASIPWILAGILGLIASKEAKCQTTTIYLENAGTQQAGGPATYRLNCDGSTVICSWSGATRTWTITSAGGGGATIPSTTNIISGDGAGNGADSGIAPGNVIQSTGSYSNPSWITALAWSKITGAPSGTAWSAIANPTGNLALTMGAYTSTLTYNAATGSGVSLFTLLDTASNTGTGSLLALSTAASSTATPFSFSARGNNVMSSNALGVVTAGSASTNLPFIINSQTGTAQIKLCDPTAATCFRVYAYSDGNLYFNNNSDATAFKIYSNGALGIIGALNIPSQYLLVSASNSAIAYPLASLDGTSYSNLLGGDTLFRSSAGTANARLQGSKGVLSLGSAATPPASALLDMESTTLGLLVPRMTTTQRTAIASPAEGLEVWDTTAHTTYHYNGTSWVTP